MAADEDEDGRPAVAVLGLRPHTYWTAAVALAGPVEAPQVLERRRIVFANGDERFVFHQAAEAGADGPGLIEKVRAAAEANAHREIAQLVADLGTAGIAVRVAAASDTPGKAPPVLADILASHAKIHDAEGRFYRDAVASACRVAGLDVRRVIERDLAREVSGRLGVDETDLAERLRQMGSALGPPWSEDQKLATLGAWLCL
jgi:hypothetical protein